MISRRLLRNNNTVRKCQRYIITKLSFSTKVDRFELPQRHVGTERNVWVEYTQLARDVNTVDLAQDFPDFSPPEYMTEALASISKSSNPLLHQYTREFGHPRLVTALAKMYSLLIERKINPQTEVLVTFGAFEALYCCINGHVDIGDEVIIMEPCFACYAPMIKTAGGIPKLVPLRPKKSSDVIPSADWTFEPYELRKSFNNKTKMIIVNTPHNPLGRVSSLDELMFIANLCNKWNVLCLCDEVYEWLVFEPKIHVRMATLPDMWQRTITIGSAGKTFGVGGWRTGWAYGPANLLRNAQIVHQNCVNTPPTPVQEAIAVGLEIETSKLSQETCYFLTYPREFKAQRDYLVKILSSAGMIPTIPDGGAFILADWTQLASKIDLTKETDERKDYRFTKRMAKDVGLLGIPGSAFYSGEDKTLGEKLVRFCFVKTDDVLRRVAKLLQLLKYD